MSHPILFAIVLYALACLEYILYGYLGTGNRIMDRIYAQIAIIVGSMCLASAIMIFVVNII